MLWKSLHREQRPSGVGQNTILQEVTQDNTWNTASYAWCGELTVQTLADSAATALDFRMAALPKSSTAVGKEWFNDVSFVGDSLTQGMQIYSSACRRPLSAPTGAQAPASWSMAPPASAPMAAQRSPWRC